jgi:RNA polymerase sigma factor for flagellar operon FliA
MDQAQRDALAREHLPLVDGIVATMAIRFSGLVEPEDLRSYAMEGLADAIDRFDESRGVPFGGYAARRIRGAVYDGLAQASWLPRRLVRKIAFYRRADEMLSHASESPPPRDVIETTHRLADRLGEMAAAYVTTYDAAAGAQAAASEPQPDAESLLARKRHSEQVRAMIATLPESQQTLIDLYFYEDCRLAEIAERLGHHKSWASRVLVSALGRLKTAFERAGE